MGVIKEIVQRADSWVNAMTGLGTLRDKLMHAQVVPGIKLEDHVLEALFNDDDVARRIVSKLPREATRRGFKLILEGDGDQAAPADVTRAMELAWRALEATPKLRDGWIWARLYGGGSGVLVGADDGLPVDQPLNEAAIRSIRFLNLVKRPQLTIKRRYEDVTKPEYGKPEIYTISQNTVTLAPRQGLDVHASRLILFDGAMTARMTMDSPTGFDDSVLQQAMTTLQQTATAWQSTAHLMTDASQGVLKIANLVDLVAAGGQETLRSRIQLMDLARSVCRSILVDAEKESFERVSTSFAGLPEVMDRLMMRMSATAEQPVTLLYGRSPAGLNATGESDIRGWYDTAAEAQVDELKPRLERLLKLMFLAKDGPTRGRVPEDWSIEFNPLWQPTDKELADTKKVKADTYVALVGAQIMTDAEAGIGLASDFPTIDVESRSELAEADKEEGLRPREVNTPTPPELEPDDEDDDGEPPDDEPRGDSNQPRVPAGSPQGGQWAAAGTAVGGPGGSWTKTAGATHAIDEAVHSSGARMRKVKTRTGRTKHWELYLPDGSVRKLSARATLDDPDREIAAWMRGRRDAAGGGGDSTDPKGRSDSQARVPKGSPQGGQFASKGGPASGAAHAKALADAEEYGLHGMPTHQLTALAEHSTVSELRAAAGALLKQKSAATTPQGSVVVAGQVQRLPDAVVKSHKPREIADALPRVQTDSGAEFDDRVWISDYMTATGASKTEVARQWASGEIDTARLDLVGAFANQRQRVESSQVSRGSADAHFILVTPGPPRKLKTRP